jgi:DNA-binding MarR family transcriptional regulator
MEMMAAEEGFVMTAAVPIELAESRRGVSGHVLRGFVGYNLKRAYMVVQPAVQAALAPLELRILSFASLSMIVDNPGITPSRLAELLAMERSNVVGVIDELEARELVRRNRLETDRRRFALTATTRGRRLRDRAAVEIGKTEDCLLSRLDAGEQAQLVRLLNKIETEAVG